MFTFAQKNYSTPLNNEGENNRKSQQYVFDPGF